MTDYHFVDLADDHSLVKLIAEEERIGIDTEFMREKTFFSQLCLIQIATQSTITCADPLGLAEDTGSRARELWRALVKPEWVLHSGRQDIEVIYQTCGLMPVTVFDTQIAAALLGFQPQIGYAGLVAELFNVSLQKSHTRADWSKRPLSAAVLDYAAEDVAYLLPARDLLVERLDESGRLDWAIQDSADLLAKSLYQNDPKFAINRLKGARNLSGRPRAAADKLAAWREREALRTNRPRQWILRDAVLIEIAISQPTNPSDLQTIEGMPEATIRRAGEQLMSIVLSASVDETNHQPPPRPNEKQKSMLKQMQQIVANTAAKLGIATEIVAPKKELAAAMLGNRSSRVFKGWRRELFGDALLEILENK